MRARKDWGLIRLDLKEMKKKIEREKKKKEKAESQVKKLREELIAKALEQVHSDKLLANGVFSLMPEHSYGGSKRRWEIGAQSFSFGDEMAGIVMVLDDMSVGQFTLTSKEFPSTYALRETIRISRNRGIGLQLMIGADVSMAYLKTVVAEYGLRIDISRINDAIKVEGRHGNMYKLKKKLILSGAAEGLPLSDLDNNYLEIEEQYARMLHNVFRREATDLEVPDYKDLRHEFELLEINEKKLFLEMGRAMFQELLERE